MANMVLKILDRAAQRNWKDYLNLKHSSYNSVPQLLNFYKSFACVSLLLVDHVLKIETDSQLVFFLVLFKEVTLILHGKMNF